MAAALAELEVVELVHQIVQQPPELLVRLIQAAVVVEVLINHQVKVLAAQAAQA
jgi:hypothetical protein